MNGRLFTGLRGVLIGLVAVLAVVASVVGVAAPAGAIVGGNQTSPYSYPYYVRLRVYKYSSSFQYATCGGSIIDSQWILTAAHCMTDGATRQQISVQVMILDNCGVNAVELRIHPLWDGDWSNGHDLALLRIPNGSAHCVGPTGNQIYPRPIQVGEDQIRSPVAVQVADRDAGAVAVEQVYRVASDRSGEIQGVRYEGARTGRLVRERAGSRRIGPDHVALNLVGAGAATLDDDACVGVAGNQVPRAG